MSFYSRDCVKIVHVSIRACTAGIRCHSNYLSIAHSGKAVPQTLT